MPTKKESEVKKLYRSQSNRMIAGVCGGIAEYFNIDPTLIRIIVIVIALFGGVGILAYIAAIVIIPLNPEETSATGVEPIIKDKSLFWGSLLIILGLFFLFRQTGIWYGFDFWRIPWQMVWAFFLIAVGGYMLYNRKKTEDSDEQTEGSSTITSKKLYRSKEQKMFAGVCGGIAEYFDIDVSIVRILWAIVTIASAGIGLLVYILMVIIFPETPEDVDDKKIHVQ